MKTENTEIRICSSHQDEIRTPLIWTFAFSGAEYWCPYCGKNEGMFGAGVLVKSTAILRNRLRRFKKLSKGYLRARSIQVCSATEWEGKMIHPWELPQSEKEKNEKYIVDWKYGQKPLSQLKEQSPS